MTGDQVSYLADAVRDAPGTRVLTVERVMAPLASALAGAGVTVATACAADLVRRPAGGQVDAVICVGGMGEGDSAAHLRLLRSVRRRLVPDGVLILGQRHIFGMLTSLPEAGFDPLRGTLPSGERLYTVPELSGLLARAGFAVERIDGDFVRGTAPALGTRELQLIARPLPAPPRALAGGPDGDHGSAAEGMLDLRWAPDEADFAAPPPRLLWQELLAEDHAGGAEAARYYPLDDPYGATRAAPVVSAHFGVPVTAPLLTFGAGATAVLCGLAGLAEEGEVIVWEATFPDLPAWCQAGGSRVRILPARVPPDELVAAIEAYRPALVHLDRPTITGMLLPPGDVEAVAAAAARAGTVLSLDETHASYLGPAASAVPLVRRLRNLVVTRSLSKGYCWGGLRIGYAVASEAVSCRVRELVPPLQASELAYRMALRLLAAGDMFTELRPRVMANKPRLVGLLRALDIDVHAGHPMLPWVLIPDPRGRAAAALRARGVLGKTFYAGPGGDPSSALLRLSVPLSTERLGACCSLLGAQAGAAPQQRHGGGAHRERDNGAHQERRAQAQGAGGDPAGEGA